MVGPSREALGATGKPGRLGKSPDPSPQCTPDTPVGTVTSDISPAPSKEVDLLLLIRLTEGTGSLSDLPAELVPLALELIARGGLLPLFYSKTRRVGQPPALPEALQKGFDDRIFSSRIKSAATWIGIEKTLSIVSGARIIPTVLKGAHLGLRYYPEPFLRPMCDLDLLFPVESELYGAREALLSHGFTSMNAAPRPGKDPLAYHQHLTPLVEPCTGLVIELHGSLIYPARDRRWLEGLKILLEGRDRFEFQGVTLEGLNAEAHFVYLCAHSFRQLAGMPPKALSLVDLGMLVRRASPSFDWERLVNLARAAAMEWAVYRGVCWLGRWRENEVPPDVMGKLAPPKIKIRHRMEGGDDYAKSLANVAFAAGPFGPAKRALQIALPSEDYMRYCHSDKARWPLVLLYPYRWCYQAAKLVRWSWRAATFW